MKLTYKNYKLTLDKHVNRDDSLVIAISLDGEELENGTPVEPCTLESAIQWIDEDIKCREDETEEKYYLEEGDDLYCDGVDITIGKNNILCFNGCRDDSIFYYDGIEVEFDDDGKPYIEKR